MKVTSEQILNALSHVDDPDLHKDLVTLNMIRNIVIEGNLVKFDVELTTPACPMKDMIRNACVNAVHHFVSKDLEVDPNMTSRVTTTRDTESMLPGVKNIVAVASGKGGVGKSTVTVNLALALAQTGARVGVLDADIYGPSIPTMFGLKGSHPEMKDNKILPLERKGIKVLSIGFLVDEKQAIVWRGPMASSAIRQMVSDVAWGELDYLLIDLPPGTGDIHLTITQSIPLTGAVMVTTPQNVALADCRKAMGMFSNQHINIPVLGVLENMSYFSPPELPDKKYYLFGQGGGMVLASEYGVPLLGMIPISETVMRNTDSGTMESPEVEIAAIYQTVAGELARHIAIVNMKRKSPNNVPSSTE